MINYSVYTSNKSTSDLKSPFLLVALTAIILVYGIRCYYIEDSKNSTYIIMFFMSLILFWRCMTIRKVTQNPDTGNMEAELEGTCFVWFVVFANILKLSTEIVLNYFTDLSILNSNNKISQLLKFTLNVHD